MVLETVFSHLEKNGSDLNFSGILMRFASRGHHSPATPSGRNVKEGSYEDPDSHIILKDKRTLHVAFSRGKFRLTVVRSGSPGYSRKLASLNVSTMEAAIKVGKVHIDGVTLVFADKVKSGRLIRKLLAQKEGD